MPSATEKKIRFVTLAGMLLNLLLVGIKAAGGILFGSHALLADAFHSLSDLVTDCAVLFGVRYWSAPPDKSHPYGHGRIETLISAFIGIALGATAIGLAWEALSSLNTGNSRPPDGAAFYIALSSIILKEALFRWTRRVAREVKSGAVAANAWHHRSDALSSIPAAAAIACACFFPQFAFVDRVGALLVSLFILYAAWKIVAPTLRELTDAAADKAVREEIVRLAMSVEGIKAVHKVRARNAGGYLIADLHIMVDPEMTVRTGHSLSHRVRSKLIDSDLNLRDAVIHLEPYTGNQVIDISHDREKHLQELLAVWEDSVRATHTFLSEEDIVNLKPPVLAGLREIPCLCIICCSGDDSPCGFMGVAGDKLEMLFLRNVRRGGGLGGRLLVHAIEELEILYVDVNEQNPAACGFYEHFGFKTFARSELDGQGNPFPILHMKR